MADQPLNPPAATPTTPHPFEGTERHTLLDVIRGVALLGIFPMNIAVFAMPFAAYSNPTLIWPYEGLNRLTYLIVHPLFEWKMMTLFSMLFGAGVVMYARKAEQPGQVRPVRWLWVRRNLWLLAIGLVHAYLVWEGDILVPYAVAGLLLLWWVRRLGPVWLVALALVGLAISTAGMGLFGWWAWMSLTEEGLRTMRESWGMSPEDIDEATRDMREMFAPTAEGIAELYRIHRGGYTDILSHRVEMVLGFHLFFLPIFIWRIAGAMLLGMALAKWGVLTGQRSRRTYAVLAVLGLGVGMSMTISGVRMNEANNFDAASFALWGTLPNSLGSIPSAVGMVGLIGFIHLSGAVARARAALAAVGRMALTNYLAQSLLGGFIFYGYGLGLYGRLDRFEQQLVVLAVWCVQIAWSSWWLRRFRFGPAEWVWRSLSYWSVQPMRRKARI